MIPNQAKPGARIDPGFHLNDHTYSKLRKLLNRMTVQCFNAMYNKRSGPTKYINTYTVYQNNTKTGRNPATPIGAFC